MSHSWTRCIPLTLEKPWSACRPINCCRSFAAFVEESVQSSRCRSACGGVTYLVRHFGVGVLVLVRGVSSMPLQAGWCRVCGRGVRGLLTDVVGGRGDRWGQSVCVGTARWALASHKPQTEASSARETNPQVPCITRQDQWQAGPHLQV